MSDLDRHPCTVLANAAVDLSDGSTGHRLSIEPRQQRLRARAEILDEGALDMRKGGRLGHHLQHRKQAARFGGK